MNEVRENILESNGVSIRYLESGAGRPVLIFPAGDGLLFDEVAEALALQHRVMVCDLPASGRTQRQDWAIHLARALARLDVASFSVIGVSQGTAPALAQAIYTPKQIDRLILLSPPLAAVQDAELGSRLREITAPTLVLVGTRDRSGSRQAGHRCREQIPSCHLILVYEAGHAIAADRREACLSPIGEFLEQGEGFIVCHDSQLIHP
jgi:pimeloyl-ACP methyl ester carboxylesterase